MAIALFFSFSLLVGTSLGQNPGNDRILNNVLRTAGDVVNRPLDLNHEQVKLTIKLVDSGLEHGTNLGKMGVAAGTTLSSQGLGGSVDIGKQSLDLVGTVSEIVPGSQILPVRYVTDGGKTVLDVGNNVGQKSIKGASVLGNEVLDKTKTVTKITTGTIENLSSARTRLAKDTVSTSLDAVANVLNTGVDAFRAIVPGFSQAVPEPTAKPEPEPSGWFSFSR
uniref:Uncharacterized protein n=1 Tax=Triatoma dimidiata TaxID=72491 RepID=D1MWC5_TRIDM|nr:hypothetical protein Td21 similar to hemolysin-like secreted salivary protein 3 [Triatoma dimidiata]